MQQTPSTLRILRINARVLHLFFTELARSDRSDSERKGAVALVFIPAIQTKRTVLPVPSNSSVIKIATASNIRVAMNAAEKMGFPLTHFVTINYTLTSCPTADANARFAELRNNRFGKWITRERVKASWRPTQAAHIWVFENPDDITHVHWVVHVPSGAEADFEKALPRWLRATTGGPFEPGALDVRPVDDPSRLALYMLKGADARYTTFSRIIHEPQGELEGRRCGVARCLNRAARKEAGINGQHMRGKNRPFYRPPSQPAEGLSQHKIP